MNRTLIILAAALLLFLTAASSCAAGKTPDTSPANTADQAGTGAKNASSPDNAGLPSDPASGTTVPSVPSVPSDPSKSGENDKKSYTQITQEQAKEMMKKDDGHLIVDVRRQDEYNEGHIPGAICLPNESIGTEAPDALPDRTQILLIYCRSGRRSKEASQKLADLGYTNVYEFGGILDWTGKIVTEPAGSPGE